MVKEIFLISAGLSVTECQRRAEIPQDREDHSRPLADKHER